MGTTVGQAIEEIGGGTATDKPVKAVLTGVSAAPLPAALLDTRLTYEDMEAAGSGLGTASLMVLGQGTDMTAVAAGAARFLAVESCGQCTPCKADGLAIAGALEALCQGDGGAEDLDVLAKALTTVGDNARCNLARQQQAVVGAIVDGWLDEVVRRAGRLDEPIEPRLVAEVAALGDGGVTVGEARRTHQAARPHGGRW